MSRPNKCIKDENGVDQWISRSTVVIPIVFKLDLNSGNVFALVEKRGPAVSHPGEWCCPCGYIDWDESLEEACQREVREETGLELDIASINFYKVESDKYTKTQSVDLWYECWTSGDFDISKVETKDEILDLKWLKVAHIYHPKVTWDADSHVTIFKKDIYAGYGKWAFKTHHKKMVEMLKTRYNMCTITENE